MKNPFKWLLSKQAEDGYVPNRELFTYGVGLCGQTANGNFISSWLFYFCTDVLKITPGAVGVITAATKVWDGINDPLVGAFIDSRKYKAGQKFKKYLTRLPLLIGLISTLMFCDFGLSTVGKIIVLTTLYVFWDFFYSFQEVSIWGTAALISPHSAERSRATQWLYIGSNAGFAAVALVPLVMGFREQLGISEKTLFFFFALFYCAFAEVLSLCACVGKERVAYHAEKKISLKENLIAVGKNKMLLLLILAQLLGALSITVPQIYFFKYMVSYEVLGHHLNGEQIQFFYLLIISTPGTLGMFFTNKAAKKLGGMRNVLILAQSMTAVLRIVAYFVGYQTFPQMLVVMLLMTIASIPSLMNGIAIRSLIFDSIDYTEWKTGQRTEAISGSLQNLVTKIASALANLIGGFALEMLHYNSDITSLTGQNPLFYKWLWPMFMLGPVIGLVLYLIPLFFIRYSSEQKENVEAELKLRHEKTAAENTLDEEIEKENFNEKTL